MYLKEFITKMNTTKDTVRFYLELSLLTPIRKGKNYWFTDNEVESFQEIKNLQELGFSLKEICAIKELHDQSCGTKKQHEQNLRLIEEKIAENDAVIRELRHRKKALVALKKALKKLLIK